MLVRFFLALCLSALGCVSLQAEPISSLTSFIQDLHVHMARLHPDIASKDRTVRVINPGVFEAIPTSASSSNYTLKHVKSLIGRTIVPIVFTNDRGRRVYTLQAIVDIDARGWFVKTVDKQYKGEAFNRQDVELSYESIRGKPPESLRRLSQVVGKEAAYTLSPGVRLTRSMVLTPPLIKARDTVDAILSKSTIQLAIKGKALEDGRLGDTIRVKLLVGRKSLVKGEVLNDHSVRILDYY